MLGVLLAACSGPAVDPDPPIPGEAIVAHTVAWAAYNGSGQVRAIRHDGKPGLAIGNPNPTLGTDDIYQPPSEGTVVRILAPPLVGGEVFHEAVATLALADRDSPLAAGDWTNDGIDDLVVHERLYAGPFEMGSAPDAASACRNPPPATSTETTPWTCAPSTAPSSGRWRGRWAQRGSPSP